MKKIFGYMEKVLHIVLALLLIGMTVFIAANVISRYVFNAPITWAEELVRYMFIWSVMTGAVAAMAEHKHLNVDILPDKLPPRGRLIHDIIVRLVICGYLVCLAVGGWMLIVQDIPQLSPTLRISMSIPYGAVGLCTGIMAIQEIYFVIDDIKKLAGKEGVKA